MNSIDALSQHLVPAAMVVARVSGLAVQGPVLSSPAIPMRIKALLVLSLGLAVYPSAAAASELPVQASMAMLAPLVGSLLAPKLFAIALLCCGLNSTVTATMAGQIVMEGFLDIRLPAWMRRLITRIVAIVPAAGVTLYYGAEGTGMLLILSQVVLAFQLPFAIVPLVMFTRDKAKMGGLVSPLWLTAVAAVIAAVIISLNVKLLWDLAAG